VSSRQLVYCPTALRHLDELWDYIAKANAPAVADRYLATIFDYRDGLVDSRSAGPPAMTSGRACAPSASVGAR